MTLQENIVKFDKVVKANPEKLNAETVREIARAIIVSDISHIGEDPRGKYEHLSLGALAASGVTEFSTVCAGGSKKHDKMSDVMLMRIMCDVITLILDGDQPLAMKYSSDVSKAMGKRKRVSTGNYAEFAECEVILNSYSDNIVVVDDSMKAVFEKISGYLSEIRIIQPKLNPSCSVLSKSCFSDLWLPEEFDSHGFDISSKEPKIISGIKNNRVDYIKEYELACVMDALIRAFVGVGKTSSDKWAFLRRVQTISSVAPDCFPIGVGVGAVHRDVYFPGHFINNQSLRAMYGNLFSTSMRLDYGSVEYMLKAVRALYKV